MVSHEISRGWHPFALQAASLLLFLIFLNLLKMSNRWTTMATNGDNFFSLLRAWGPSMQADAQQLRKDITNGVISGELFTSSSPSGSRPWKHSRTVLTFSSLDDTQGRDMDAASALAKISKQVEAVSKSVSEIEDETAGAPQTIQQLARVAKLLHE